MVPERFGKEKGAVARRSRKQSSEGY